MSSPDIRIVIKPQTDRELITVTAPRTGREEPFELPPGTLKLARDQVVGILDNFKEDVGGNLAPATDRARTSLRNLFGETIALGTSLTRQGSPGLQRLSSVFLEAIPNWRTRADVPLVEVEGPDYGFPFELLPVFSLERPKLDDIEGFARRFLGFSAAVRRLPWSAASRSGQETSNQLATDPSLPVSFAWYAPMAGAKKEHTFFHDLVGQIELNGPWPSPALTPTDVLQGLATGIVDPHRRYNTERVGHAIQIHHVASHSDTRFDEPADYELELADLEGQARVIAMKDLVTEVLYTRNELPAAPAGTGGPLVFLNACGSAHKDPRRVYSWPEWFLQEGHRAVIGPETLIPDDAAAEYACFFYTALFSQCSAGESLVVARRKLLHDYGNPLGLLYVLYGDASLTVDKPIPLGAHP